jgi:hypothetical protein
MRRRQEDSNQRAPGALAFLALAIALALGVMAAIPASGLAATTKFGAKLSGDLDPVEESEPCPGAPGACTRAPIFYEDPTHAGPTAWAPRDGVIDKIRLVSSTEGVLYPEIIKMKGGVFPIVELKVKSEGDAINYEGTGAVESFDVDLPVKQGQWLGFRATYAGPLQCEPGVDAEAVGDPALAVGGFFHDADYYTGCTHLLQAVME